MRARSVQPTLMIRTALVLLGAGSILLGCGRGPTPTDQARLAHLCTEFSGITFSFDPGDLYLRARAESRDPISEKLALEVFRAFWLEEHQPRTDSSYVYLNIYDRSGKFQFQVRWDPEANRAALSSVEHY